MGLATLCHIDITDSHDLMHAMMDGDIRFYHQNRIILDQTLTKPFGVVQRMMMMMVMMMMMMLMMMMI